MRALADIVRQSLSTLWAHKLRSFLTMFGIAWGVGSLLLAGRTGRGLPQRAAEKPGRPRPGHHVQLSRTHPGGRRQHAVRRRHTTSPTVTISRFVTKPNSSRAISPVLNREDIRAVSDYGSTNGQVFGVAPVYNQIRNVPVGPGRWFNDEDNTRTPPRRSRGMGVAEEYLSRTPRGRRQHPAQWNQFRHHWRGRQSRKRREQRHQRPHLYSRRNHAHAVSAED